MEGRSLVPALANQPVVRNEPLFFEHEGSRAVRDGKWKLVASFNEPWELYDIEADRVESNDLAASNPKRVQRMARQYDQWADRAGVKPWPAQPAPAPKAARK
jgi:arylsulfatase